MSETTHNISVIICAYTEERWYDLVAAVKSLQNQSFPAREIIIVIDHNTPMYERVRGHIPGVLAIENREQRGLSGGRNSGIKIAQSELIAFLDDDAVAEPDWLMRLSQCCEKPEVLGAGGGVEPLWSGKFPAWFPQEFYWIVGCSYLGLPEKLSVIRNPFGGCSCFRREVFEVVGGFRSGIGRAGKRPLGCEETELCIRARQHWPQKVFLYDPQARIHHRIPSNRATLRYFRSRCYAEGMSKALVARYVGSRDALASERTYTFRTLPLGVISGLMDSFFHLNTRGIMKATTIVYGFIITTIGYMVGKISLSQAFSKELGSITQQDLQQSLNASNQLIQNG
jgi:GT2 family glycosyltransferase